MTEIQLLPGNDAFPELIWERFAHDQYGAQSMEVLGEAIQIVGFPQPEGHWVVTTAGLSRIPLHEGEATEAFLEIDGEAVGAAVIALQILIQEVVQQPRRVMWAPGRVWMNSEPILEGTRIQALVMPDLEQCAIPVTDEAGAVVGHLRNLWMLTKQEARSLALDGPAELLRQLEANPRALTDVERGDLASTRTLPDAPCIVSREALEAPARRVEMDFQGRFAAFTLDEDEAGLNDPDNYEVVSLLTLAERNPGPVTDFLLDADPGDFLEQRDGQWHRGRLDPEQAGA